MRQTVKKARRVELDSDFARVITDSGFLTIKSDELYEVRVHSIYFSMFPVMGILVSQKKQGLKYFKDYDLVIKSQKMGEGTFVGMVKTATYNNVLKILHKRKILAKHVYFTPFSISRLVQTQKGNEVIVYKADKALHVMHAKDSIPLFSTTYFTISQLDEFLKEYFDDGNVHFTLVSNSKWDYSPPVEFKEKKTIVSEGVIINALS